MLLRPISTGPTSDEYKPSPSVSSWLVEMLMSSSSGPIRSSSRTLQMRFVESGPASRGPPAGAGLAVLSVWVLLLSNGTKWKKLDFLGKKIDLFYSSPIRNVAFGHWSLETVSSHSSWIEKLCSCVLVQAIVSIVSHLHVKGRFLKLVSVSHLSVPSFALYLKNNSTENLTLGEWKTSEGKGNINSMH